MVLLRKTLISKETESSDQKPVRFWSKLSPQVRQTVQTQLLLALEREPQSSARKKLSDTISELALFLTAFASDETKISNEWPQLLPFLFRLAKSENDEHRKSALDVFGKLCLYLGESLAEHFDLLKQLLTSGLVDPQSLRARPPANLQCAILGFGFLTDYKNRARLPRAGPFGSPGGLCELRPAPRE